MIVLVMSHGVALIARSSKGQFWWLYRVVHDEDRCEGRLAEGRVFEQVYTTEYADANVSHSVRYD